jgi:hypothetical protein
MFAELFLGAAPPVGRALLKKVSQTGTAFRICEWLNSLEPNSAKIGIGRYRQIGFVDLEAVPFGTAQPRDR